MILLASLAFQSEEMEYLEMLLYFISKEFLFFLPDELELNIDFLNLCLRANSVRFLLSVTADNRIAISAHLLPC